MIIFVYIFLLLTINFNHVYAEVLYMWSQVVPENKLSVRAIVENDTCPIAYVDGKEVEMLERFSAIYEKKIEKVCEILVKRDVEEVKINETQIPTLPEKIKKIAFIGDTGCRINMLNQQECNSIVSWPLKKNLDSIAFHKPDLVIHVGDYHYRKNQCRNTKKCGNIYGYNSQAWYTDWFNPAKEISLLYPFLFVRGNHESCNRAHEGWFRYLDPYPFLFEKCENFTPSWFFDIESIKLFVFDSSSGQDIFTNKNEINIFSKQFDKITHDNSNKPIWFLTHRPLWRSPKKEFLTLKDHGNISQVEAFANKFPSNVSAIVSGHIHIAQILLMDNVPDQIIVGNGGALLHAQDQEPIYQNIKFNYSNDKHYLAREVRNFFGFGFAILNLDEHELTFYNQDNKKINSIKLTENFKILADKIEN